MSCACVCMPERTHTLTHTPTRKVDKLVPREMDEPVHPESGKTDREVKTLGSCIRHLLIEDPILRQYSNLTSLSLFLLPEELGSRIDK